METMDKGLTVPKWVLINWPKIPQMPQNVYAQIVCPSPKVWDFDKKGFIGRLQSVGKGHVKFLKTSKFQFASN